MSCLIILSFKFMHAAYSLHAVKLKHPSLPPVRPTFDDLTIAFDANISKVLEEDFARKQRVWNFRIHRIIMTLITNVITICNL